MNITCYGILIQLTGGSAHHFDLAANATVQMALDAFEARFPSTSERLVRCACAIGTQMVAREYVLDASDTLVIIPPVSGG